MDGFELGIKVGTCDGLVLGARLLLGETEAIVVGKCEGETLGRVLGNRLGTSDGSPLGEGLGLVVGLRVSVEAATMSVAVIPLVTSDSNALKASIKVSSASGCTYGGTVPTWLVTVVQSSSGMLSPWSCRFGSCVARVSMGKVFPMRLCGREAGLGC